MDDSTASEAKANHVPSSASLPKNGRNALHDAGLHGRPGRREELCRLALALETTRFRRHPAIFRRPSRNVVASKAVAIKDKSSLRFIYSHKPSFRKTLRSLLFGDCRDGTWLAMPLNS